MSTGYGPKSIELIMLLRRGPRSVLHWPKTRLITRLLADGIIAVVPHPTVRDPRTGDPAAAYALTQAGEDIATSLGPRGEGHPSSPKRL